MLGNGFQIVQHQADNWDLGVGFMHQPPHLVAQVFGGAPLGHCRQPALGSQNRNRLRVSSRRYS